MRRAQKCLAIAAFLVVGWMGASSHAEAIAPPTDVGEKVPGAERLEGRLLAPCCFAQTLDIHGSEIASTLRHEIRSRLKAGETADVIEASLVARYGEKMRAVPDRVPLDKMGGIGWFGVALAAGFIGLVLWRWRQRGVAQAADLTGPGETPKKSGSEGSEASDDQLESELHRLDDN